MEHIKEPWTLHLSPRGWLSYAVVVGGDGNLADMKNIIHHQHHAEELVNIKRAIECVNACADIKAPESIVPGCVKFVLTTDYKMLGEQKQSLLIAIEQAMEEGIANDLTGILHLIDSLQETAVKIGIPETIVYPKNEDDEE